MRPGQQAPESGLENDYNGFSGLASMRPGQQAPESYLSHCVVYLECARFNEARAASPGIPEKTFSTLLSL